MKRYEGQQAQRLSIIASAFKELDDNKLIDWKKFQKIVGDNRANFVYMAFMTFLYQEKLEHIPVNELTELDIALMDRN